jgi:hypothetical protein
VVSGHPLHAGACWGKESLCVSRFPLFDTSTFLRSLERNMDLNWAVMADFSVPLLWQTDSSKD